MASTRLVLSVTLVSLLCLSWLQTLDVSTRGSSDVRKASQAPLVLSFDNILFVNIRKSGGIEFKSNFPFGSTKKPNASTLSSVITGRLHTKESIPKDAIEKADAYLYNLRHPIDRVISWYLREHPSSCLDDIKTRLACETARDITADPRGYAARFFQKCFPTENLLPLAFDSTYNMSQMCRNLARQVLNNEVKGPGFKETPFHYDVRYYANKTIDSHPNKTVLVVRSESILADLLDLERKVGGNGTFKVKESFHDRVTNDELTDCCAPLCFAMREEVRAYRRLLDLAVNIDEASKEATVVSAAQYCGFPSWVEMEEQMTKRE